MIIYLITNLINGKQYVGQTIHTVQERWANPPVVCMVEVTPLAVIIGGG